MTWRREAPLRSVVLHQFNSGGTARLLLDSIETDLDVLRPQLLMRSAVGGLVEKARRIVRSEVGVVSISYSTPAVLLESDFGTVGVGNNAVIMHRVIVRGTAAVGSGPFTATSSVFLGGLSVTNVTGGGLHHCTIMAQGVPLGGNDVSAFDVTASVIARLGPGPPVQFNTELSNTVSFHGNAFLGQGEVVAEVNTAELSLTDLNACAFMSARRRGPTSLDHRVRKASFTSNPALPIWTTPSP